jgi:predicted DNA-binding ribbon-helix-helix protein
LGHAIKKDFEPGAQAVPFSHPLPRHDDPKIKFFHQSRRWYNVPSRWGRQHEIADRSATVSPLGGRTTTVTLENAFWLGLKEIARRRRIKVSDLVKEIGAKRKHSNFSSELRLFVLEFYRKQANLPD